MQLQTSIEMVGVLGLAFESLLTLREYQRPLRRTLTGERELGAASGAFQAMLERHFDEWGLTGVGLPAGVRRAG